ncbi:MAG: DNA polymerase III subunit delta [Capsulimonas sp.]|uniref:DNA polymerase III subunit delta n=1 Tax=Capsulimonas sp. TaxID=2494211 RepID=UPI0032658F93
MEIDYSKLGAKGFPQPAERVYLFTGSDDALKREGVARLTDPLLDPSAADFDREVRDVGSSGAEDLAATQILASAGGVPMFSERRVVVITNIQRLSKEEQDDLAAGLGKLGSLTCLVLIAAAPEYEAGKVKGRSVSTKLQNAVTKTGAVVVCDAPLAGDLKSRAAAYLKTLGKTAEPAALEVIVQRAVSAASDRGGAGKGGDLLVLHNELDKAAAYAGDRTLVTRDDALAVGTRGAEENIFALLDAVGSKDAPRALRQVEEMLRHGDKPDAVAARTFVMLARHLRMLWGAKYLAEKRITGASKGPLPEELQAVLSGEVIGLAMRQAYLLRSLQDQARRWSYDALRHALARVLASDMAMKGAAPIEALGATAPAGDNHAANLQLLVVALCRS